MNTSLIITGSDKETRAKIALEIGLTQSSKFDLSEVDAENEGGIEIIREIQKRIAKRPFSSSTNVVIIKEAQKLTLEAQNAFLKSLEEPPEKSRIILTSPNVDGLPPTIISRCHVKNLGEPKNQLKEQQEKKVAEEILTLLKLDYGARLLAEPQIDFESWLLWWREMLLNKIIREDQQPLTAITTPLPQTPRSVSEKGVKDLAERPNAQLDLSVASLLRNDVWEVVNKLTLKRIVDIIVKIEETKKLIEKNANKKLSIDVLLLNLPKLEDK